MKDFLKMVLAVICGLFLMSIISIFLFSGFVSALTSSADTKAYIPKEGVLAMDMSKISIVEQASEDPFADLEKSLSLSSLNSSEMRSSISLLNAVHAINAAAEDPDVKFIYIKPDNLNASLSSIEELRKALGNFRRSGKAVIAYTVNPTTATYYLASVSDKVYMSDNDGAMVNIIGVGSEMMFFKDILDQFGINIQLIRHGKYKSAGEAFIRNSPSTENAEQYQSLINSIWGTISTEIAASRGIDVKDLNKAVDNLDLCFGKDMVQAGLVDSLLNSQELKDRIATLAVNEDFKDVHFISFPEYTKAKTAQSNKIKNKIAIIYADGEIVDGKDKKDIAGDRFASEIEKIANDPDVKAVVLRVNSPGGSVLASEKIKEQLDRIKGVKPLIASYGDYAASGGYWISNNCDKIFSDATTLTGSIGVFSMLPDLGGLFKNKLKIGVYAVNSNKHSDMYNCKRALDESEKAYLLRSVEAIYDKFTGIVAQGRSLDRSYVDEIGQGRVWSGAQGVDNKLVDEIGTLEDAVNWAAVAAGESDLTKWNITGYPKPVSTMDSMLEMFGQTNEEPEARLKAYLENLKEPVAVARLPYIIKIR